MTLSAAEIALVVGDLRATLLPAVLRRMLPLPGEPGFVLDLRSGRTTRLLAVSLHPMLCRIHLVGARPQRDRTEATRGFVRTASATLAGLPLIDVERIGDDRAVALRLEGWSLAIELMGRHANAFLLDRGGIIRSSYRAGASRKRSLLWGGPYVPPIPRPGAAWAGAPSRFAAVGIHEAI
ncbi:MAG: NFACT family protein, partial [Myxococcota bacterium]|nr:NFACT family protein [Myxococcota bacterium]